MKIIADLHIHSKYSRAVSRQMNLEQIDQWAQIKGVDLIATGDFTHPAWFQEIASKLTPQANGLLKLKGSKTKTQFVLSQEFSCIYKKQDRCRRIHLVVLFSQLEKVKKLNQYLGKKGFNLKSDGRPILGLDVKELAQICLEQDPQALIIPAHIWTPWFSLYGSKSGFQSFRECFEELAAEIPAIETGLSSDPAMNWRLSDLNQKMILSNSDAHSPEKIGREANVFEWPEASYQSLYQSIKQNKDLLYTIEFYPEEGKYHYDGHRLCGVSFNPEQTKKAKGICPKCGRPVVVGVVNRVMELADQEPQPKKRVPYKSLVPLKEILAEVFDCGVNTKAVAAEYQALMKQDNEFNVLLARDLETLKTWPKVKEGIQRVRAGKIIIEPGYDGEYGKVQVFSKEERGIKQKSLF